MWVRNASSASKPGRSRPSMWSTVWITPAVHLDLAPADDLDAARLADPRLVVAVHVGAHGQLGLLLGRGEQLADVRRRRRAGSRRGRSSRRSGRSPPGRRSPGRTSPATRRPGTPPSPRLQEELIRRRVALPQPLVERGRRAAPARGTRGSAPPRTGHRGRTAPAPARPPARTLPGCGSAGRSPGGSRCRRPRRRGAARRGQPAGGPGRRLELIAVRRSRSRACGPARTAGRAGAAPGRAGRRVAACRCRTGSNWKARS